MPAPKKDRTADWDKLNGYRAAVDNSMALTREEWEEFSKLERLLDPDAIKRRKEEAKAAKEAERAYAKQMKREKHLNYARLNLTLAELKTLVKEKQAAEKAAKEAEGGTAEGVEQAA